MLVLSFALLCGAAAIGGGLAVAYLSGTDAWRPPTLVGVVHAALGIASLTALLLAIRDGLPRIGMGTAGFGPTGAALIGVALTFGLRLAWLAWRRRRPSEILVFTHAGFAIAGVVVLLALVAIG